MKFGGALQETVTNRQVSRGLILCVCLHSSHSPFKFACMHQVDEKDEQKSMRIVCVIIPFGLCEHYVGSILAGDGVKI